MRNRWAKTPKLFSALLVVLIFLSFLFHATHRHEAGEKKEIQTACIACTLGTFSEKYLKTESPTLIKEIKKLTESPSDIGFILFQEKSSPCPIRAPPLSS